MTSRNIRQIASIAAVATLVATAAGCSSSSESHSSSTTQPATKLSYATTVTSPGPVNPAAIPLGDGHVSSTPKIGYVNSCVTDFSNSPLGGAFRDGPWINSSTKTWDSITKVAVEGAVRWSSARYNVVTTSGHRLITTNDLPVDHTTGIFPIGSSDPAYGYDRNPNSIRAQSFSWTLPLNPVAASSPRCLNLAQIGVLNDGVVLFDALDGEGRDAGAHETLDNYQGHPQGNEIYHHHAVPAQVITSATGRSTLVGYALDGYGIYVERNANGTVLSNTQLDACHGRTSKVLWNGRDQSTYHYDATLEYPYTLGCFHGSASS